MLGANYDLNQEFLINELSECQAFLIYNSDQTGFISTEWQVQNDLITCTLRDLPKDLSMESEFLLVTPQAQLMQIIEHHCEMPKSSLLCEDPVVARVVKDSLECEYESREAWMFRRKGLL